MVNKKSRIPMSPADRAKQFMPFAALKGLPEALAEKEKTIIPKKELSEEYKEELDRTLSLIGKKDMVAVVYFHENNYVKITGMVSEIKKEAGYLMVVNTKISFSNIAELSIIN